mmetsp:Transcript_136842/g.266170  ORF Transcript_136842/g.266170 Transcript_136842/m.266170 type:complete len:772 (+) Transcript_136842:48-2363(+)
MFAMIWTLRVLLLPSLTLPLARAATCPGNIQLGGHGAVSMIPTGWGDPNAAALGVSGSAELTASMGSRAYFAEQCNAGTYSNEDYLALNLLGKTLRYTTDLSGAGCGCNAAMYLTSLKQNTNPSECHDYYCDANNVCGQSCAEIDIQEANQVAWHSTLHSASDRFGVGGGYGGGDGWNGARDWNAAQYGPHASCIDTTAPFEVAVSFPISGPGGTLTAMLIKLTQQGRSCPLTLSLGSYKGMTELSQALQKGMTPIISYWSSDKMLWMDGKGTDQQGPCAADKASACGHSVKFYNFSVADIGAPLPPIDLPPPKSSQKPTEKPSKKPDSTPTEKPGTGPPTLPTPAPAPVPLPVPMPFPLPIPPGVDINGKTAIFDALGALCGTGSTAKAVGHTLLGYVSETVGRIHKSEHQELISCTAIMLGLASAWDGPLFYRTIFTIVFVILVASMADFEVKAIDFTSDIVSRGVVLAQVSTAAAIAVQTGFEGSQVVFGILVGLLGAWGSSSWTEDLEDHMHGIRLLVYSQGAILGCLVFTAWRPLFLKTLAPLVGGFLVASGLGALFGRGLTALTGSSLLILPPPSMDWATGADCLLGTRGKGCLLWGFACGLVALIFMGFGGARRRILAISTLLAYIIANAVFGAALRADALGAPRAWPFFGCLLWAFSTAASAWRQLSITDEAEIRESLDNAMGTMLSMRDSVKELDANAFRSALQSFTPSRLDQQLPTFERLPQNPDTSRDRYRKQKDGGRDTEDRKETSRLLMLGRQGSLER